MQKISKFFVTCALGCLTAALSLSCFANPAAPVRFPAEWEKHEAIWLSWPTYESIVGRPSYSVQMDIIKALAPTVKVKVIAQSGAEITTIKELLAKNSVPTTHVSFFAVPHNDIWMRDMGPLFVRTGEKALKIVDFNFNVWGYESANSEGSVKEEKVDRLIASELGYETLKANLIMEGGNLETNGAGTLITTESVFKQRNPKMTKAQGEAEYRRVLGIEKVIWMKQGVMEDDHTFKGRLPGNVFSMITTGGHTDEYVRFAGDHTILLTEIPNEERQRDPIAKVTGQRLDENFRILQQSTNQSGKHFDIIRMPSPEPLIETIGEGDGTYDYISKLKYEDGTVFKNGQKVKALLATSYMNYLVTNGVVLAPAYWKPGRSEHIRSKDLMARKALEKAFPGRKIININPENVNIGGGGMHCITQQQPAL